jgi:hypothetical protein
MVMMKAAKQRAANHIENRFGRRTVALTAEAA